MLNNNFVQKVCFDAIKCSKAKIGLYFLQMPHECNLRKKEKKKQ